MGKGRSMSSEKVGFELGSLVSKVSATHLTLHATDPVISVIYCYFFYYLKPLPTKQAICSCCK